MNRELAEVRRYWPRAVTMVSGEWYTAAGLKADLYHIGQVWQVTITTPGDAYRRHCQPTIAQAMRAAGFGERKQGFFAEYNEVDTAVWLRVTKRHADKCAGKTRIPLVSRQRPRKKVRLGKRGRRLALAASIGEALDATKHWRASGNTRRSHVRSNNQQPNSDALRPVRSASFKRQTAIPPTPAQGGEVWATQTVSA